MIVTCTQCNKTYTDIELTPHHTEFKCKCGSVINLMKLHEVELRWARERVLESWPLYTSINTKVVDALTVLSHNEGNTPRLEKASCAELLEELASRIGVSFPNRS